MLNIITCFMLLNFFVIGIKVTAATRVKERCYCQPTTLFRHVDVCMNKFEKTLIFVLQVMLLACVYKT